ncbi:MAG: SH3 domain-containing protein [Alcanivoracaceae bacterium]|nr:SH3 domain-containing protein [Alcanivoracaceae bacterium]
MPRCILVLILMCSAAAYAADSGSIIESTSLHVTPNGQVRGQLSQNTLIQVLQRDGAWYEVKLPDGRRGYVPLRSVKFGEEKASDSVFGGLWSWLNSSRRSQDDMSSSTAGIRGFDEKELDASEPDYDALKELTGWAAGADSARKYAAALPLSARTVKELDDK